jgi:WD40 repeat protein
LRTSKADANGDGRITVSELRDHVAARVSELTAGYQRPSARRQNPANDFVVYEVRPGVIEVGPADQPLSYTSPFVALSAPTTQLLTAHKDGVLRLWDLDTGHLARTFEGAKFWGPLGFSPDGKTFFAPATIDKMSLRDAQSGRKIRALPGEKHAIDFSPDGRLAIASPKDTALRLYDGHTGRELTPLTDHPAEVQQFAFDENGRQVATACADGTVTLWDAAVGKVLHRWKPEKPPVTLALSGKAGRLLIQGKESGTLWDTRTFQRVAEFSGDLGVAHVRFSPDGRRLVVPTGKPLALSLRDGTTGTMIAQLPRHSQFESCYAFSPDGRWLVSGEQGLVKLWDAKTGTLLRSLGGHRDLIVNILFLPEGNRAVSLGADNTVRLWSLGDDEP